MNKLYAQRHDPNDHDFVLSYDMPEDGTGLAPVERRRGKKTTRLSSYRGHIDGGVRDFPSRYCQWKVSPDGSRLAWDGGEKFNAYELWLRFLIARLFKPWGVAVHGWVDFIGMPEDAGILIANSDSVIVAYGMAPHIKH